MICYFVIITQIKDELNQYLEQAPSLYNPVIVSLFIFVLLLAILIISYRYIYNPMLRKHKKEQREFEKRTAQMLVTFSELDPNPIIRINSNAEIIGYNKSAKERFPDIIDNKNFILSMLEEYNHDLKKSIEADETFSLSSQVNERYYEINFHGISFLDVAQLYFRDITAQREYDEQMKNYQQLLRNASVQTQKVVEEERNRLARVLHDSVAQNILLTKLNVGNYKKYLDDGLEQEEFSRTINILDSTIQEVRDIARNLRPVNIDELGLLTVIRSLCNNVAREAKLKYQIQLPENSLQLNKDVEVCMYRLLQESLNNIMRHSKAKSFTVDMLIEEDSVLFAITDDGIGFKPKKLLSDKYISEGMGLMGMQESVERLNGSFKIETEYNKGTKIITKFPLTFEYEDGKPEYKNIGS